MQLAQILLVEDDEADVVLVRATLAQSKLANTLHHVFNGIEALKFLRREPPYEDKPVPDLMILDLNMPLLNGHETLVKIREDEQMPQVPIVIMTSSARHEDVAKSYAHHANCYVVKPLDLAEFRKVILHVANFWLGIVKLPTKDLG